MHENIQKAARAHGFAAVFFLAPLPLALWREKALPARTDRGMPWNIPEAFPRASCILLLAAPYAPYAGPHSHIPAYYMAENRAYFKAKALAQEIAAAGFYCENAQLPARALALANSVGAAGPHGLLALPACGTRCSLFTLATDACAPLPHRAPGLSCPAGCDACARACPTGAIGPAGLEVEKCLRYHMDGASHPPFVREKLASFLGCEICQSVCPKNAHIEAQVPEENALAAFDLRRLILGDASAARALVGKNITGGGKLTAEAIVLAAKRGLLRAQIGQACASSFPAVRETAAWAIERYFS